jgi:hypothetical protein
MRCRSGKRVILLSIKINFNSWLFDRIIYNDFVEASTKLLRNITIIDPKWILAIAPNLYQKSSSDDGMDEIEMWRSYIRQDYECPWKEN